MNEDEWGNNKRMGRRSVEHAVLKEVQRLALEDGRKDVPRKIKKFRKKAKVFFFDGAGNPVDFNNVQVVWEE